MKKLIKFLLWGLIIWVILFMTIDKVKANTALIYHSNYSDAHTNVKSQLEADGYTVTLSTTGTVHDNLKTNNMNGLRFEVAQLSDRFGPGPSAYITISENLEVSA